MYIIFSILAKKKCGSQCRNYQKCRNSAFIFVHFCGILFVSFMQRRVRMEFRPCIDIHNGKVKQIVGGSLLDEGNRAKENFVAEQDAAFFAKLYREQGLKEDISFF